jgi:hypothetical protein
MDANTNRSGELETPSHEVEATIRKKLTAIADRIRLHAKTMPAAAFTTHPKWADARWTATTFRWHPNGETPPVIGLVFENAEAGNLPISYGYFSDKHLVGMKST